MPGTWTETDDRQLWSLRSRKSTSQLATMFGGKTSGAIRSRLKHLQDPEHKAYKRRVAGVAIGQSSAASVPRSYSIGAPVRNLLAQRRVADDFAVGQSSLSFGPPSILNAGRSASPMDVGEIIFGASPSKKAARVSKRKKFDITTGDGVAQRLSAQHRHPMNTNQPKPNRIDPSTLNSDQKAASEYILEGGNAFLTGPAGVGKSYLLNYVIQGLCDKHDHRGATAAAAADPAVVVAASTGIAATHINGVTIHSWSGVRLGVGGARVLLPRVLQNEAACQRWRKARVLVLDEVSMIDGEFFEALDAIGREVRNCRSQPFGGIQIILTGDFFQLPPVSLSRCGFAFESPAWKNAAVKMVELRTVVRQSGDPNFVHLLNRIRLGECPSEITRALENCHVSKKPIPLDGITATKLYCTNKNVDEENNRKLAQLPGKEVRFPSTDSFKGSYSSSAQKQVSQMMDKKVPSDLRLKVGAQVFLTRNMPTYNLVNGFRGIVNSFDKESRSPVVLFSNGVRMMVTEVSAFQGGSSGAMTRTQLPLKLAWCLTVHKSQGMTIERAELQLDDAFDFGQVYVALSRITSLDGLWVRGGQITQNVVKCHPKVKLFYEQNRSASLLDERKVGASVAPSVATDYHEHHAC